MKDGYGKKHYTIDGSDIKLRQMQGPHADPSSTWPAAVHPFQVGRFRIELGLKLRLGGQLLW